MKKFKINGFILLESITALSILSLTLFSLSTSYSANIKTQKKFLDTENLAYCIRSAAIAKKRGAQIPENIVVNNLKYEIDSNNNLIRVTSPITNNTMELKWNEK